MVIYLVEGLYPKENLLRLERNADRVCLNHGLTAWNTVSYWNYGYVVMLLIVPAQSTTAMYAVLRTWISTRPNRWVSRY